MFTQVRGGHGGRRPPPFDRLKGSLKVAKVAKVAKELNEVSASARWRWFAQLDQLPEKALYRPKSLSQVAEDLEAHKPIETKAARVVVKAGDDLGKLAATHLGIADRLMEIFEANRDVIDDPREIHPGWALRMP